MGNPDETPVGNPIKLAKTLAAFELTVPAVIPAKMVMTNNQLVFVFIFILGLKRKVPYQLVCHMIDSKNQTRAAEPLKPASDSPCSGTDAARKTNQLYSRRRWLGIYKSVDARNRSLGTGIEGQTAMLLPGFRIRSLFEAEESGAAGERDICLIICAGTLHGGLRD